MDNILSTLSAVLKKIEDLDNKLEARLGSIESRVDSAEQNLQTLLDRQNNSTTVDEINQNEVEYVKKIGSGTFAEVNLCRWKGRDVAAKEMKSEFVQHLGFMYEYSRISKLNHKNLIEIYGLYTSTWPPIILMEYGKDGSLRTYLQRNKTKIIQKTRKLLKIGFDISEGMAYLESQNIVHRSLAARNCFYVENRPCKISDYGLTKTIPSSKPSDPIRWLPPEFFVDKTKVYTLKTDTWSLGVVLWEIYKCGNMPYGTLTNSQVVDVICEKRGILERPGHCPEVVYNVMKRCWLYDPTSRPFTSEVRELIREAQISIDTTTNDS